MFRCLWGVGLSYLPPSYITKKGKKIKGGSSGQALAPSLSGMTLRRAPTHVTWGGSGQWTVLSHQVGFLERGWGDGEAPVWACSPAPMGADWQLAH